MDQDEVVLALQDYIRHLDRSTLPRILQVCSGVYFQGSVYELSGSEVCLSTGDLVKVTACDLLSVSCEDLSTNSTFELPLTHTGLFKLVSEDLPYSTVEEMVGLQPVGVDACGSFSFISRTELIIDNLTVPAGTQITLLCVEEREGGERSARCQLIGQQGASASLLIPLSCHGEFYECENHRGYSLQEIMLSERLCKRRFRKTKSKQCGGPLVFLPIYEVQGIMHMRKNMVKFPSSLEVDVMDVSEQCRDLTFVTPLSMCEVTCQPSEVFPSLAEILEPPEPASRLFNCGWFKELQRGKQLILHEWRKTEMVLACTPRGRRAQQYFLISHDYGGQMRRRPQEFSSVYEVYVALSRSPGLRVSVTKNCEAVEEEGVPGLSVGDQLEVLSLRTGDDMYGGPSANQDKLVCRIVNDDDDEEDDVDEEDEECKEISLPLFTSAHFVEKLSDKKKYTLAELKRNFSLPLEVKIATRDKSLEKDPLVSLTGLILEEVFEETTIIASLPERPELCFSLPVRWIQMSLSFTSDPLPWTNTHTPELHLETVTEITDHFYHEYHRLTQTDVTPPPRPPKQRKSLSKPEKSEAKKSRAKSKSSSLPQKLDSLSLDHNSHSSLPPPPSADKPPPLIPRKSISESCSNSNTYVQTPRKSQKKQHKEKKRPASHSDSDYETVPDLVHDSIMFY